MLYLDPAGSGIEWLLDPDNPAVLQGLRAAAARRPADACDPLTLADDIPGLVSLVRQRHFGLATGSATVDGLDTWARQWEHRLRTGRPKSWGAALGTDLLTLRHMLGDAHTAAVQHEDPAIVDAVDPRAKEPVLVEEDGPAYEESVVDGVLCVRVRRMYGTQADERDLTAWQEAHERHFTHDRILVDLRGNGGGNDGYLYEWAEPHNPREVEAVPPDRTWTVGGRPLSGWNAIVQILALRGEVPPAYEQYRIEPRPDAQLTVTEDTGVLAAGERPWHGRMAVLTDRRTRSSGESSAWALRQMFGARLAGTPTGGCISYGNVVPYLLPRSGMRVSLPTKQNMFRGVEFVGIPVDVPLDPRISLAEAVKALF
jgi:hypothetical protein